MITNLKELYADEEFKSIINGNGTEQQIADFINSGKVDKEAIKGTLEEVKKAIGSSEFELTDEMLEKINAGVSFGDVMGEIGYGALETIGLFLPPEFVGFSAFKAIAKSTKEKDPSYLIEGLPYGKWIRKLIVE